MTTERQYRALKAEAKTLRPDESIPLAASFILSLLAERQRLREENKWLKETLTVYSQRRHGCTTPEQFKQIRERQNDRVRLVGYSVTNDSAIDDIEFLFSALTEARQENERLTKANAEMWESHQRLSTIALQRTAELAALREKGSE